MTKLDAGLMTSLPAFDPGSAAVWGNKRINPRPQSCLCLAWSGYPSNDDDVELVTSNATSLMDKRVSCIAIQGLGESSAFVVPDAFAVNEVVDVSSSIPTNKMAHAFPHLRYLDFPLLKEKRVDLLLGCD